MAWTEYDFLIASMMVIAGTFSTVFSKWTDNTVAENSDGKAVPFHHPFVQAAAMFVGQLLCLFVFKMYQCYDKRLHREEADLYPLASGNHPKFSPFYFLPPTLCDMMATSAGYLGLNLTYASSSQMLTGSVIIFTGFFSIVIIGRRLRWFEWLGILAVIAGLTIVGLADFLSQSHQGYSVMNVIIGDVLIVLSEVFSALQVVLEEKFVDKYNVNPFQAVGWEGFFGVTTLSFLMIPMYFIYVGEPFSRNPRGVLEDALDAFVQIGNSSVVAGTLVGTLLAIAFLNFAGMSITKRHGALTRMVLDALRTMSIWIVSLAVGWEHFSYIQLIGFVVLVAGMCLYNDVVIPPLIRKCCGQQNRTRSGTTETSILPSSPSIQS